MPKSSSETPTPASPRQRTTASPRSWSTSSASSVISIRRRAGGVDQRSSAPVTASAHPGSSRVDAETLTATPMSSPWLRQLLALGERRVEHVVGQLAHHAGLLGQRHELTRCEQPALGVLPAHERLHLGDLAGREVDDRLVIDDELPEGDGVAQLADELQPLARVAVLLLGVEGVPAPRGLGLVHGHVGVPQEDAGVLAVLREDRDPDAGADLDVDALDREAILQGARDPHPDLLGRARAREEHRELVAAEAGEDVVGAQDVAQARAELGEHGVARVMAERVIELLEAVDVDDQESERLSACARAGQVRAELVAELAAVGEAGELVRRRLAAGLVEAADLADGERGAGHRREHRRPRERHRDRRDVNEPGVDEQHQRRDREEDGRHQHTQVAGIDLARLLERLPARERHDHERDDPQRVEHRAGRVRVGGQAREVERIGEREEPEAGRQERPGAPAAPSVQHEHRDREAEQKQVCQRVGGVRQHGRPAPSAPASTGATTTLTPMAPTDRIPTRPSSQALRGRSRALARRRRPMQR